MTDRELAARDVCARLADAGHRALLAGGCVRDRLLGIDPKDFDVATSARAGEVIDLFDKTVPVGAAFGVVSVRTAAGPVEVATFRKDGPYDDGRRPARVFFTGEREDALRRDFTVNALFLDPATDEIIDYVDGRADLENRVLRAVGDPFLRFGEDHLRLMRCVRFAARLGFTIDDETWTALEELAPNITRTSAERIRDELVKILTEGHPRRGMELLRDGNLLEHLLPEVAAMQGVEQPPGFHPEGDVWTHTMMMLDCLENPSLTLAMGVLLHDVGKPPTQTFEDRIRFSRHERVGRNMAEAICRRLRFSRAQTERIAWLVGQHMRLAAARGMKESKRRRFVRERGFGELLALCRADCLSSHRDLAAVNWVDDYAACLQPEEIRPKPLLRGGDLIAMGYAPGPRFGALLRALEDAQLEGSITTVEEARAFVRAQSPLPGESG